MMLLPQNESMALKELDRVFERALELDISGLTILPQDARAELLPYLAHMFDVDISGLSESESRTLIANAVEIHRYQGTLYAVKKAVESVFDEAKILEWFKTGGEPYTFKVEVSTAHQEITPALAAKANRLIETAKNARSKLEEIIVSYLLEHRQNIGVGLVGEASCSATPLEGYSETLQAVQPISVGLVGEVSISI